MVVSRSCSASCTISGVAVGVECITSLVDPCATRAVAGLGSLVERACNPSAELTGCCMVAVADSLSSVTPLRRPGLDQVVVVASFSRILARLYGDGAALVRPFDTVEEAPPPPLARYAWTGGCPCRRSPIVLLMYSFVAEGVSLAGVLRGPSSRPHGTARPPALARCRRCSCTPCAAAAACIPCSALPLPSGCRRSLRR